MYFNYIDREKKESHCSRSSVFGWSRMYLPKHTHTAVEETKLLKA